MVPPQLRTLATVLSVIGLLMGVAAFAFAPRASHDLGLHALTREPIALDPILLPNDGGFLQHETVRRGELLSTLMTRLGADDPEFERFVRSDRIGRKLLELAPGRSVSASLHPDKSLRLLTYRMDGNEASNLGRRLVIRHTGKRFVAYDEPVPIERTVETRSAEIKNSLFQALDAADIPDNVLTRIADVFGDDVNLRFDVRRGDRLRVVYETLRESGSLAPPIVGRILAIQFRGSRRSLEAIWFERDDQSGQYYTFDGRSLKRSFLTSPLEFTRVSSGFTDQRQHPIKHDWRAHRGIDFSAPPGTKVRSTAEGVVTFAGTRGGYGKVIILQHGKRYSTLYAHLSGFAAAIRVGQRVQQGELIGFVGQTGWATGPHLHYEFHVNGQHVNPIAATQGLTGRNLSSDDASRLGALVAQYRNRFSLLDTQVAARFE